MIGKTVSHYKIIEKLGEGGMGVVYKVKDTKLDRIVALKFLTSHFSENEEAKKRFFQEAQVVSALQHITSALFMKSMRMKMGIYLCVLIIMIVPH